VLVPATDCVYVDAPIHSEMTVRAYGSPIRIPECTAFNGLGRTALVSFFGNSIHNLVHAVKLRVFCRKVGEEYCFISSTSHDPGLYQANDYGFEAKFMQENVALAPMNTIEFVSSYQGHRRVRYAEAAESLEHYPLTKEDANCKCFLKKEKDIRSDKPDAVPRVITFPDPRYGLEFGKFVKPAEHVLFQSIDNVFGNVTVMKGKNYDQVGAIVEEKWNMFADTCSVDCDVSRLDSSISNEAQRLYHKYLQSFYYGQDRDDLARLCEFQLDVQVEGRAQNGTISFPSQGLGSGQMNTSQMGVFIVCYIVHSCMEKYDLRLEMINSGDDFSVIGEKRDVMKYVQVAKAHFAQFNMVLKMEDMVDYIEGIEFCQTHPVKGSDGKYRMCRNPRTALVKDSVSIDRLDVPSAKSKYLKSISDCGKATHGDMPVFRSFYRSLGRAAKQLNDKVFTKRGRKSLSKRTRIDNSMFYWGKDMNREYVDNIDESVRFSFFLAFDIDAVEQRYIESYYDEFKYDDSCLEDQQLGDVFEW